MIFQQFKELPSLEIFLTLNLLFLSIERYYIFTFHLLFIPFFFSCSYSFDYAGYFFIDFHRILELNSYRSSQSQRHQCTTINSELPHWQHMFGLLDCFSFPKVPPCKEKKQERYFGQFIYILLCHTQCISVCFSSHSKSSQEMVCLYTEIRWDQACVGVH